ncbi:Uncharacterized protein APZ42_004486 [Daphnia magna]|uniref:Uncharacterized protein n=1 Tax=Daphnia magna TaxID=35525 RepID=A0A164H0X6_9CRUS|nr:Uncharacterized protein APZ42_004486 [Daphnia magna]
MANENRKLSRYLKRKLNLKEAQEEIEQMVKKKAPCHQKVNNHFSDNEISSNPQQSEQPSSEPVTCVLTSQFHEDEDPKNIAELKSKTSSQNSVAEGCESYDSDEEYNLNEKNSNTFEVR